MSEFDPVTATENEILAAAHWLEGRTLNEIGFTRQDLLDLPSSARTKGVVGRAYEEYFRIRPNSDPRPDFRAAGIELKSTGLSTRLDGTVGQKERISLRMLGTLDEGERWATTPLRRKLDHLLVVFYAHQPATPMGSFRTLRVVRWTPQPDELELFAEDWSRIQDVRRTQGRLSETLTKVLASSTKGAGRRARPGDVPTRGYSLKPRFVHSIFLSSVGASPVISLQAALGGHADFEEAAVERLRRLTGHSLNSVRQGLGRPLTTSKNGQATLVRAVLDLPARGRTKEFDRYGFDVKTVPMSPDGKVWERMSFPAFDPMALVGQSWDESDLLGQLTRLLVVPLLRPRRDAPREEATLGRAFLWAPPDALLKQVRTVWDDYRAQLAMGRPDHYPRMRDGKPIFVNSHGRDGQDRVRAPGGRTVTRRSFWLHPDVVARVVMESHPAWRGY